MKTFEIAGKRPTKFKTDWRELKYRKELFLRYATWRLTTFDLDHSHYCRTLCKGMTDEQKCWFSFLFGMTYRTPQAYAYWYTFPDFEKLSHNKVVEWNADNWKRTTYGTDARYNKGHFAKQVWSLMNWKGSGTLLGKVQRLTSSRDPKANFEKLFQSICEIYKYGRMTGWITTQCLYDVLELNIDFDNVLIRNPAADSSMMSVWNGYCMLEGRYKNLLGKQYGNTDYSPSSRDLQEASKGMMKWRDKVSKFMGYRVDVFKWESVWCQFKRLFHPKMSKEYPGHASGDAVSRYTYYREHWPEINWKLFRQALLTQDSIIRGQTYVNDYNRIFGDTGLVLNVNEMYPDMPNVYECLGLDPNENLVRELFTDHGKKVPRL